MARFWPALLLTLAGPLLAAPPVGYSKGHVHPDFHLPTVSGGFKKLSGTCAFDAGDLTTARFTLEIDTTSLWSDTEKLTGHLKSPDFFEVNEFPTATFALSQPIELGAEPADGVEITTTVAGELTLRGVTNDVTFELTAKQDGERIGVLGNIPVVFADYEIATPSAPGITTQDNGLLEFVLVFEPTV